MKKKTQRAINKAMLAEQQAADIVAKDFRPPTVEQMSKKAQLVHYKDRAKELEYQVQIQNAENRTLRDDNYKLTKRCERYERLLDHLTGHLN